MKNTNLFTYFFQKQSLFVSSQKNQKKATLTVLALPEDARPYLQQSLSSALGGHSRLRFIEYLPRKDHLARAALATGMSVCIYL